MESAVSPKPKHGQPLPAGTTAALVRDKDWSLTPLGPMEGWPQSLRTLVDLLLAHPLPLVLLWGPHLVQIYNDAYAVVAGGKHPAALGMPTRECWPEVWHINGPVYDRVLRRGEAVLLEDQLFPITRHGAAEDAYFTVTYSPAHDDAGAVAGVFVTVAETTQKVTATHGREQLLLALRNEQSTLAAIIEHAPAFMCVLRGPEHVFELANERYYEVVGKRDVIGKTVRQALPEVEGQGFFELLDDVYRTGETFEGKEMPVLLRRRGGEALDRRFMNLVYQALRDADLAVSGVFVHGVDVTDLVRSREALRASEEQRRLALDSAELGAWHVDPATMTLTTDARFRAMFGVTDDRLGYEEAVERIHPDDRQHVRDAVAVATRPDDPAPYAAEYRVVQPDGSARWVFAKGRANFTGSGTDRRIVSFDGTLADISDRRLAEAERQALLDRERAARAEADAANRAKDRFLAVLSHELRTPVSPVLLIAASMADDPALPPAVREDGRTILRNVAQQVRLIDDLLDVTRIEHGKISLRAEATDLHDLLRDAVGTCKADADAKRLRVETDLRARRHVVSGDPARLRQVFCNLLKNAAKFTPAEGRVTVRSSDRAGGRVAVEVADTGMGVEPDLLAKMFDAFEQGGRAITDEFSGLGLGLAISKGRVEAHGGSIAAASEGRGRGTTMTVELPAADPAAATGGGGSSPVANRSRPSPGGGRPLNILLVDDHHDTLRAMSRLLTALDHRVTAADSKTAALEAAAREAFDLVISDVGLPDGTGLDLMRELAAQRPIRGIALTGYGTEGDMERTRAAGFSTHLTKPIDFPQLEAAIRGASA